MVSSHRTTPHPDGNLKLIGQLAVLVDAGELFHELFLAGDTLAMP